MTSSRLRQLLRYSKASGLFIWRVTRGRVNKGDTAGSLQQNGYINITIDGKKYQAHQLALLITDGRAPTGLVDHVNGLKADNRRKNLRPASHTTNAQNIAKPFKNNKLGVQGVCAHKGKFQATIQYEGRSRYLGLFDTPKKARSAYLAAKRAHHPGYSGSPL